MTEASKGAADMCPTQTPRSLLTLPAELRQRIYEFCIPQGLTFEFKRNESMYKQNREEGWLAPPWHSESCRFCESRKSGKSCEFCNNKEKGTYYSYEVDSDCPDCAGASDWNPVGQDETPGAGDAVPGPGAAHLQSDTCARCMRYYPGVPAHRRSALPGLLLLCRQITDEVEAMLYGGNTFEISLLGQGQLAKLDLSRLQRMRHVTLVLLLFGPAYLFGFQLRGPVWESLLGNLSDLTVIAMHTVEDDESDGAELSEGELQEAKEDLEQWISWLVPKVEDLSGVLAGGARVVVHAGNEKETVEVFERFLPGRCRFQTYPRVESLLNDVFDELYWSGDYTYLPYL